MEVIKWNLCFGKLIWTHLSPVFLDIDNFLMLIYVLFNHFLQIFEARYILLFQAYPMNLKIKNTSFLATISI